MVILPNISVYDGVPRTKQQIDAVAGGFLGEAKREGKLTFYSESVILLLAHF